MGVLVTEKETGKALGDEAKAWMPEGEIALLGRGGWEGERQSRRRGTITANTQVPKS